MIEFVINQSIAWRKCKTLLPIFILDDRALFLFAVVSRCAYVKATLLSHGCNGLILTH